MASGYRVTEQSRPRLASFLDAMSDVNKTYWICTRNNLPNFGKRAFNLLWLNIAQRFSILTGNKLWFNFIHRVLYCYHDGKFIYNTKMFMLEDVKHGVKKVMPDPA